MNPLLRASSGRALLMPLMVRGVRACKTIPGLRRLHASGWHDRINAPCRLNFCVRSRIMEIMQQPEEEDRWVRWSIELGWASSVRRSEELLVVRRPRSNLSFVGHFRAVLCCAWRTPPNVPLDRGSNRCDSGCIIVAVREAHIEGAFAFGTRGINDDKEAH